MLSHEIQCDFQSVPMDFVINKLCAPLYEIQRNLSPFRNFLQIAHINSVSIPKHRDEIERFIKQFDIIGFSETNIKRDTPRDLYKFQGYKMFHINRNWGRCGGVAILVKEEYAPFTKLIQVNYSENQPELIFAEIEINKVKICVGVIYKSPSERYGVYSNILEILAFLTTKFNHCIFLGDFNIDNLKVNSPAFKYLKNNILDPLSLTQIVKSPTRITFDTCTLIDLILVSCPESVKFCGTADFSGVSDHKLVYCSYSLKKIKYKPQIIKRRDFRNFVKEKFSSDMLSADWNSIAGVADLNINEATNKLELIFLNTLMLMLQSEKSGFLNQWVLPGCLMKLFS